MDLTDTRHLTPRTDAGHLAAHWMPFTGNRQFKASPRLITAAQAAHWSDLPRFYDEVRRIAEPNAILALISYGVLHLDGALGERFEQFYWQEIGPYWPAERKLVDSGYATIDFPFAEFAGPPIAIRR